MTQRSGTWEHARKWVKRNPAAAGLAGAVALLAAFVLVAAPLVSLHQTTLRGAAEAHARQADWERTRAREQTRRAEAALYRARLNEARALRLARLQGWSELAFENIRQNAQMQLAQRDLLALRGEAVACMTELDVREIGRLGEDGDTIGSLDFHPAGTFLASADDRGGIRLWEMTTHQVSRQLSETRLRRGEKDDRLAPFPTVRFHPSGQQVAFATWSQAVAVVPMAKPEAPVLRLTAPGQAQTIAYDAEGRIMAVAWSDGRLIVYEAGTGEVLREVRPDRTDRVGRELMALSPDGSMLAAVGADHAIELHPLAGEAGPIRLGRHQSALTSLSFGSKGHFVLSSSADQTAKIFSTAEHRATVALLGHGARVESAVFRKDRRLVATGSGDQTVRLWDPRTGESVLILRPEIGPVRAVAFSPSGEHLATAAREIVLYRFLNQDARQSLFGHRQAVGGGAFHPSQPILATASYDNSILLWDLASGRSLRRLPGHPEGHPLDIAFSPDGELVAASHGDDRNRLARDHAVRVYAWASGELRHTLTGHDAEIQRVAFDPSSRRLASGDTSVTIVWNLHTGEQERSWRRQGDPVSGLEFVDPEGWLLVAYESGLIRLCDCLTGRILAEATAPDHLTDLSAASQRRQVAVAGVTGAIYLYALPALSLDDRLELAHQGRAGTVAYSPDGSILASGGTFDRQVILWDPRTGQKLVHLPPPESMILNLAFAPNGLQLAICGGEARVLVWNLEVVRARLAGLGLDWTGSRP